LSKSNALFHDGSVWLLRGYVPLPGMIRDFSNGNGTKPSGPMKAYTDIEEWMVSHPGHAVSGSVNGQKIEDTWKRGRPLPNFN
jgi:hypothetical protein